MDIESEIGNPIALIALQINAQTIESGASLRFYFPLGWPPERYSTSQQGWMCPPKALQAEQVEFPWKPCICSCVHIPTWHPSSLWPSQMRQFVLWPPEAGLASLTPHHASRIIGKGCWFPLGNAIFLLCPCQRSHWQCFETSWAISST